MKNRIKKELVADICDSYSSVILDGLEEEIEKFPVANCVIEFLESLVKINVILDYDDILVDTFIDLIYKETNDYIGCNDEK